MSRLKLYLLALLSWFIVFYNIERLIAPINLASFVYILAPVYALIIILYSPIYRVNRMTLFVASLVPYFLLKFLLGYPIYGTSLPLTVTEIASIGVTLFLSWNIGHGLETLTREILRLTLGSSKRGAYPFNSAQAEFYREIRRARHYNRPATVLSISPTKESVELSVNRFLQDAQKSIIQQYIVARTADFLRTAFKETDVVSVRNDHFLVLLPETETNHLPFVLNRIQKTANEKLGLTLKIGASTFPDDALTFESLVEFAEERMKNSSSMISTELHQDLRDEPASVPVENPELNKAQLLK